MRSAAPGESIRRALLQGLDRHHQRPAASLLLMADRLGIDLQDPQARWPSARPLQNFVASRRAEVDLLLALSLGPLQCPYQIAMAEGENSEMGSGLKQSLGATVNPATITVLVSITNPSY